MPQESSTRSQKRSALRALQPIDLYYHYMKSVSLEEEVALNELEAVEVLKKVVVVVELQRVWAH